MSSDEASLNVDLAEFNALRSEIQTFLNLQSAFLALAVAIIAAVIPVAVGNKEETHLWIVGAVPLPLAILATLYADVGARIGRAARYIEATLRPRFVKQTISKDALGWEEYVHKHDPNKRLLWWTDKIRYAIFALPAIATYFASFRWSVPSGWDHHFKIVNGIALLGASIVVWRSEGVVLKGIVSEPKN